MHRLANRLVAAEGEGDVADAPRHLYQRHHLLDSPRRLDEVQRIAVVLLDTSCHGEDVRVEDDVLRKESRLLREEAVGALADRHSTFDVCRLPLLIEGHDDDGGAISPNRPRLAKEGLFSLLEAD